MFTPNQNTKYLIIYLLRYVDSRRQVKGPFRSPNQAATCYSVPPLNGRVISLSALPMDTTSEFVGYTDVSLLLCGGAVPTSLTSGGPKQ